MINYKKNISQFKEIQQIKTDSVTYLLKLKDGRLCVGTQEKKMHIFKYFNNTFTKQITIQNYTRFITKIIQLKNDLVIFPTDENNINLIKIFDNSYEIHYIIKLNKELIKNYQQFISFIELKNNNLAVLINDYGDDKILIYYFNGVNYELTTKIKLFNSQNKLSLDIVEIPKMSQIAYYSNSGLYFYDIQKFEMVKSIGKIHGFEWTNTMLLYKEDYLIIGSIYVSDNTNDKLFYLVKCSTYEIIDSFFDKELEFMFCTALKILNDGSILCGFHMYDSYTKYIHIIIENEKIKMIGNKKLSDQQYEGEICGIEQYDNVIIAGNRDHSIYLYS